MIKSIKLLTTMKCVNLSIILAISLALLTGNAIGLESENIIGGKFAVVNQFPYQISIQVGKSHACGGALIAPNVVLTAAHCVYDKETKGLQDVPFKAVAGIADSNDPQQHSIAVTKIYAHRAYSKEKKSKAVNDIAVLRLAEKFEVNGKLPIEIVSLPQKGEDFSGKTAVVSGFGWDKVKVTSDPKTKEETEDGSSEGKLKYGFVNIVDTQMCMAKPNPRVLCGQMEQKSSKLHEGVCSGDSGGPLVYGNSKVSKVIGVVSESPLGCDESDQGAVYTRVSEYLDFVKSALADKITNEMLVKELKYVIFDIPSLGFKGTTNSPQLQTVLKFLQENNPKYEAAAEEFKQSEKELKKSKELMKSLEDSVKKTEKSLNSLKQAATSDRSKHAAYKAKYEEYQTKFDQYDSQAKDYKEKYQIYETKFQKVKALEGPINNAKQKLNSLQSTEKIYKA